MRSLEPSRDELEAYINELSGALLDCLDAMSIWGAQEDGIPDDPYLRVNPYHAYERGRGLLERRA